MKRFQYHFPLPRRERLTGEGVRGREDATPVLGVDRSVVAKSVLYRERPRRGVVLAEARDRVSAEKQPLVVERVPDPEIRVEPDSIKEEVVPRQGTVVELVTPGEQRRESYERVSVVMAHRGKDRLVGLRKTIESIRNQSIDCYIILVEQDIRPVLQDEVINLVDDYLFTYSRALFNKSWAFNCGARRAPDELILLHDGDLIMPGNYVREAIRILNFNDLALPWTRILYLTEESSETFPQAPLKVSHTFSSYQACGGSLLVRKGFYFEIGGMDERFEGWGGEDNAFFVKACKLGRIGRAHPVHGPQLVHYYHPPAPKSHHHNRINNHVMWEYYSRTARDIKMRVKSLGEVGDPLRYRVMEKDSKLTASVLY